ncbi:MAG TPA: beta-ketoacyl-ACP synthase III [Nitrospinaceae bacterium]|jgi:3-oxoacyl-[acyl-carrier-protein] synthase-3|nr:3-oxoacyl-ACP synthase [Nitrospinota bacterium]MDP6336099.1 beta-ketoacyl-ACP synthase III [Nitrospinaceae bacterium]MDP7148930.1 beta-ketoacyl-ACP synthase III [Nitrospinaceae bacterium]HAX46170.1 3-oxoacyl-ACP synthase [Nitrospina sp.]HJO58440.1 beta-ketoacyl-ACP synthase III [Nitrospinaceae bacterium]|tara:strand:- start:299 stop:1300 length:1002 start_codon:yes stop_codon:yes gene_type:complete
MNKHTQFKAEVAGMGIYVPAEVRTNADLEKTLDTSDEWIRTRTGICERHIAGKDESSSTLGIQAGKMALESANISPEEVDIIIVCTSTPDILFPATACFVQKGIGAVNAAAYDISAVCSGFVFGLSIAEQYIKSGRYRHVLVIGSETNSRIVDWSDRSTCILFGDGAGAMLLKSVESDEPKGLLSSHIHSDGEKSDFIIVPGGIGKTGVSHTAIDEGEYFIKMAGSATFKAAVKRMTEVSQEALDFNGLSTEDVTLVVPHQANRRIIDAVTDKLGIPSEKVFMNIEKYGNTSAASIPIAIHEAREAGLIVPGSLTLLAVVGAGLTWGAALIKW